MEKATISQLKNRLSAYLRKVRAGQTVLIFDRNRPVARLERIQDEAHGEDRLARLELAGLVRRATSASPLAALRRAAPKAKRSVTRALIEDRRDGR